jgi:uncharacterized protein RhaS with RHS repeats
MFGWGWGNEYEVNLEVSADGSVVVHEYGGGAENRFSALNFSQSELRAAVEAIGKVAQGLGLMGSASQLSEYKQRLMSDARFRNDEWAKFRAQGKIPARQLAVGTQLQSNRFSYQFITKTREGYTRTLGDLGKTENFDNEGRLVRISDKNGNFISFEYTSDKQVRKVVDNFNRKIFMEFNDRGLVSKLEGENGKKAVYTYNGDDELVESKDVEGNVFSYRYDSAKRHNMIQVGYTDKTAMKIEYYGMDRQENVQSVTDRDGTVTEYDYEGSPNGKNGMGVSVTSKKGGQVLSSAKYQYLTKTKPTGEDWTYKLVTEVEGETIETTYNECCGLPLVIKQGKDETFFEYDKKGHVTRKTTPFEVTELHYDPSVSKVDRVVNYKKSNKKNLTWSQFQYDPKGNLIFAKNSQGKGVKLIYDNSGRIRTLVDQNKEQINFKYNENSKPIQISDPALGSIEITYNNSGDLKEVNSKTGKRVAAQVTKSFQSLLDIIKPAGVSLDF